MVKQINSEVVVYLDMDDSTLITNDYVLGLANEEFGTQKKVDEINSWGASGDEVLDSRFKYFKDPEIMGNLPLRPGAKRFVQECMKRATVYFCTAVEPECMTARAQQAIREFGIEPWQIIIASDKSKLKGDFFFDDNAQNIKNSSVSYPVLFRQPWNSDVSGVMSVTKYEDFIFFMDYIIGKRVRTKKSENPIICLVGPSGSGKGEIINFAAKNGFATIPVKTTKTTSCYAESISQEKFFELRDGNAFAEYTAYAGNFYGILQSDLDKLTGKAILALDISGAIALKNLFPNRVRICFVEKDKKEIYRTLLSKSFEDEEERITRVMSIEYELENKKFCEYSITDPGDVLSL